MSASANTQVHIPRPKVWQAFEKGSAHLWRKILNDPSLHRFGRIGQAQYGMDMYRGSKVLATAEWALPKDAKTLEFDGQTRVYRTSASPTTSMNWTRTGRNFELLSSFDKEDDTVPSRYPVSAITIKKTAGEYHFVTKNNTKPIALEASLNTAPNPLFVHRHLAVVKSLNVQSAGRVVEVYVGAQRLLGSKIPITSGNGSVRVLEFETPAVPLCWNVPNGVSALDQFKSAHFDLFSLLGTKFADNTAQAPIGFSLFLRPLAGTNGNKTIKSVGFSLSPKSLKAGVKAPIAGKYLVRLPGGKKTPLRGILFEVIGGEPTQKKNVAITAMAIYGGDNAERVDVKTINDVELSVLQCVSINVAIDGVTGLAATAKTETELWKIQQPTAKRSLDCGLPDLDALELFQTRELLCGNY